MVDMSTCMKCGETKPIALFQSRHVCKACDLVRVKAWNAAHPEIRRERNREQQHRLWDRAKTDPVLREKLLKKNRDYRRNRYQSDPEYRDRVNSHSNRSHARKTKTAGD